MIAPGTGQGKRVCSFSSAKTLVLVASALSLSVIEFNAQPYLLQLPHAQHPSVQQEAQPLLITGHGQGPPLKVSTTVN